MILGEISLHSLLDALQAQHRLSPEGRLRLLSNASGVLMNVVCLSARKELQNDADEKGPHPDYDLNR